MTKISPVKLARCIGTILLALTLSMPSTLAQQDPPVSQVTLLTFAHDLLQLFYPELFDENHRVTLCVTAPGNSDWTQLAGVYFAVTPEGVNPLNQLIAASAPEHIVLTGSIWLPPKQYGRVQQLQAFSEVVHEHQLKELRRLVMSHPEWSQVQIADAVKQAGVRFGPSDKDAFVSSLPLNKTERFFGVLKVTSVEFTYPRKDALGHLMESRLDWVVQAEATLPDGTHPDYVFTFEPFEGKLVDMWQSLHR